MKKLYTELMATCAIILLFSLPAFSQIPNDSPIPVDVFVELPATGGQRTYDYASVTNSVEWGIQPLRETVSGELVWVGDDGTYVDETTMEIVPDSIGCDTSSMMDYTGKIVLIRRGSCNFSRKIHFAQSAGAIGVVIVNNGGAVLGGMSSGDDYGLTDTIPAVWIDNPGTDYFIDALDAGETVIFTFQVRAFFSSLGPYAYATPQAQIIPLDSVQVDLLNLDAENTVFDPMATVEITAPGGGGTTLTAALDSIQPNAIGTFEFDDYTPSDVGLYSMVFTNSITEDTVTRAFEITDYTFQMDNGDIPEWPVDSWIAPTDETFINDNNLIYDFGNLFRTGPEGGAATYASFSIGNPDSLFTGFADADLFTLVLYDADPNNDGVGPPIDLAEYNPAELQSIAATTYVLTGEEEPYEVISVPFDEPVTLKANGQYLLMAQYNGVNAGLGIPPWYTYGGTEDYPGLTTMVFTDQLYTEGWSGNYRAVVRLHIEGFTPVATQEPLLGENKLTLMPNPTSDLLNVQFDLDNNADQVELRMIDFMGRLVERRRVDNVKDNTITFDTNPLPGGTYFLHVLTPEGQRTMKFIVVK